MSGEDRKTRRGLLAGGAAVVGTAAGAVLLGATNAEAANGSPVLAGRENSASNTTALTNASPVATARLTSSHATSATAHGLVIAAKGGYGISATSSTNHAISAATAGATKGAVVAVHNGPVGSGAALVANGRNNSGAVISNSQTDKPALLATATSSEFTPATAIRAVVAGPHGVGVRAQGKTAVSADSDDGTAISATCAGFHGLAVGVSINVLQTNPEFDAIGLSVGAGIDPPNATAYNGTAISAWGNARVNGELTMSSGGFRIDHPLDSANKYLTHSFVQSPDMKNVYDGAVTADASGEAEVAMPAWFDALNKDLRYQLTAVGGPAPALHVKAKLADGKFTIAGAQAGQEICWQITGTRKDAWANANRVEVEPDKPNRERGTFLFPKGFGQPEAKRLGYRKPR